MAQIQKYKFKENSGLGKFCLKLRKEGHIISILGHVNMVASKNENRISKTLLLPLWKPVKNVSFATSKLKKLIYWTKTFLIEIGNMNSNYYVRLNNNNSISYYFLSIKKTIKLIN